MASQQEGSSSYSSSSNNPTRGTWKYDIFLSLRGEDTRAGFTSHLESALTTRGFRVFIDNHLERGELISKELQRAITKSSSAIVILSKNYASSSWCLDELQHILASRNKLCQIVFPIFYHVDPSDVWNQQGRFGQAFTKVEKKFQKDQSKVQKWRDSLTEVASIFGFDSSQYQTESDLTEEVGNYLWDKLRSELLSLSASEALIGIDWRVDQMLSVLGIGLDDVHFIGIYGVWEVLARPLLLELSMGDSIANLTSIAFLPMLGGSERNGLLDLQNKLLSHLKIKNFQLEDTYQGKNTLGYIFRNRKVMVILDDVNHISQLENLEGRPFPISTLGGPPSVRPPPRIYFENIS